MARNTKLEDRIIEQKKQKKEVAEYAGISEQTMTNVAKGGNTNVQHALLMAEFLECTVEDIFEIKREED